MHTEGIDVYLHSLNRRFYWALTVKQTAKITENPWKHKPKQLCNRTTNCLSASPALFVSFLLFGLSHTRNPTAHLIFFLLLFFSSFFCPWASRSCRHNPSKTFWIFLWKTDIPPISSRAKN